MSAPSPSAARLLRMARRRAALTQAELARRAGVNQSVISAYESASRHPSLETLTRLISATGLQLHATVRRPARHPAALSGVLGRRITLHRDAVREIAARHGLTNVRVFGSVATATETEASDVDLLVDVAPGTGVMQLGRARHQLQELLGARVELVPAGDMKPDVAAAALAQAIAL